MKSFIISFFCLSLLLVTQEATAKPSIPIASCLRKAVVPNDGSVTGCSDFAIKYSTTFEMLLLWNTGLHRNCDNLDVDNEICILGPAVMPEAVVVPKAAAISPVAVYTTVVSTSMHAAVASTGTYAGIAPTGTHTSIVPIGTHTSVVPTGIHSKITPSKAIVQPKVAPAAPENAKFPEATMKALVAQTQSAPSGRTLYPNLTKNKKVKTKTVPSSASKTVAEHTPVTSESRILSSTNSRQRIPQFMKHNVKMGRVVEL
ncbi:hypothetical protein EDD21DRAFT_423220 [Dissophora ornata]|nr:hypothetical protein BGZ58_010923 [Dissophora ornata]KAI8596016.1 hypothetical protein EDD21DRAFT_423220 [Dissophora ornata]